MLDVTSCLALLIAAGADVEACTRESGSTPMHLAAKEGRINAIRQLVAAGAQVEVRNKDCNTPQGLARRHRHDEAERLLNFVGTYGRLPNGEQSFAGCHGAVTALVPLWWRGVGVGHVAGEDWVPRLASGS